MSSQSLLSANFHEAVEHYVLDGTSSLRTMLSCWLGAGKTYYFELKPSDSQAVDLKATLRMLQPEQTWENISARTIKVFVRTYAPPSGTSGRPWSFDIGAAAHFGDDNAKAPSYRQGWDARVSFYEFTYVSGIGWLCTSYIGDVPPMYERFGGTNYQIYAGRYPSRDRDVARYIEYLDAHIPTAYKTFAYSYGVAYGISQADTTNPFTNPSNTGAQAVTGDYGYNAPNGIRVYVEMPSLDGYDINPVTATNESSTAGSVITLPGWIITHETGHSLDYSWLPGHYGLVGTTFAVGSYTIGPTTTAPWMTQQPYLISLYATIRADAGMDHSIYAYTGGILEWFAEAIAARWTGNTAWQLKNMAGSGTYLAQFNAFLTALGVP
jgi:hypothetical protein